MGGELMACDTKQSN